MIHITDLPLEATEISLIFGLALGLTLQYLSQRSERRHQKQLDESREELRSLRRLLDRILMVDKGYARPGEPIDDETKPPRKRRPSRLP